MVTFVFTTNQAVWLFWRITQSRASGPSWWTETTALSPGTSDIWSCWLICQVSGSVEMRVILLLWFLHSQILLCCCVFHCLCVFFSVTLETHPLNTLPGIWRASVSLGLQIVCERIQTDFPEELYPVYMLAMTPLQDTTKSASEEGVKMEE